MARAPLWAIPFLMVAALGGAGAAQAQTITLGTGHALVDTFSNARCFKVPPNSDQDHEETTGLSFSADITSDAQGTATTDDCGTAATNLPRATARATQNTTITHSSAGLTVVTSGTATGRSQICAGNQNHNSTSEVEREFTVVGGPIPYEISGTATSMPSDQFMSAFTEVRLIPGGFDQTFGGGPLQPVECEKDPVDTPFSDSGMLSPGNYTFRVRGRCQGTGSSTGGHPTGTDGCRTAWNLRLDVGEPQSLVAITLGPSGVVAQNTANFEFTALNAPPGDFECQVDGGGFSTCSSPFFVGPLADGDHVFEVRFHPNGEPAGAPTERRWTIDTTAPTAVIDSAPSGAGNPSSAAIAFHSTEPDGATFECRLDSEPAFACSSPHQLLNLTDGSHTFSVTAIDRAGNRSTAVTANWSVSTLVAPVSVGCAPGDEGAGFGPIRVVARAANACFFDDQVGGRAARVSLGQVTLNGITLTPAAGSRIIVARQLGGGTVRVDGPVTVRFGTLPNVLGARALEVSLPSLDLDDLAAVATRANKTLSLAGGVLQMAGSPVVPNIALEFKPDNGGQVTVTFRLSLPRVAFKRAPGSPEGVTVEVSPTFSNDRPVTFGGRITVAQAVLFGQKVKDLDAAYDFGTGVFTGSVGIVLDNSGASNAALAERTLTGSISIGPTGESCGLRSLGLQASNLNRRVAAAVFLQRFGGTFQCVSEGGDILVKLAANGGVSVGPRIAIGSFETEAVSLDGTITLTIPVTGTAPVSLAVEGTGKLVDFPVSQQAVEYTAPATIKVTGGVDLSIGGYGAELTYGEQGSFVSPTAFNIEAAGSANLFLVQASADAVFSSTGFAVCIGDGNERVGFGKAWNGELTAFTVCDAGPFRASPSARAAQAAGPFFDVGADRPLTVVAAEGAGAPPKVVLDGPGGERIQTPAGPDGISNGEVLLVQDDDADTTFVALFSPAAGRWNIGTAPGSPALARVRFARELPPVRVRARVSGRGTRRVLTWRARGLDGQRLELVERSARGAHLVTSTRRASGRARFTPDPLLGVRRTVEAVVFNGATPRSTSTVARFRVAPPRRPRRVRGIRLRRGILTWRAQRGVPRFEVAVQRPDRTTASFTVRRPRVRIPGLPGSGTLRVSILGVDATGRLGPLTRARVPLG